MRHCLHCCGTGRASIGRDRHISKGEGFGHSSSRKRTRLLRRRSVRCTPHRHSQPHRPGQDHPVQRHQKQAIPIRRARRLLQRCEHHFMMQNFTVDHIIAKAHGGTDHISNLQLLCGSCNSIKGAKSHEELLVLLTDKGWIKRKKAA